MDDRDENGDVDGSGGTDVSPVGGFGGTSFGGTSGGGSSGGGVGGTSFGTGGYYGDAGSPSFGGTTFGSAGVGCFVGGTRIATPSGATPIEELQLGDLVLAYDEHAGHVVPRPVTATFVHPDHPVGELPLNDGRVLHVTANHPVYLPDEDRYAEAGDLKGDERLLTLSGIAQTTSAISGGFQEPAQESVTVYNITVAGEHNYFAEGVLVHNKSGYGGTGPCVPTSWSGLCYPIDGCLDPLRPNSEYVTLNQPTGIDAGAADAGAADAPPASEGGPADAAPASRESGTIPKRSTGAAICSGGSVPPNPSYLAFDVWSRFGLPPAVAIYSGNTDCAGSEIGQIWLEGRDPPPRNTKTTQCVRVPQRFLDRLTIAALSEGTEVENPRFVSGCACPRPLILSTSCGVQGTDAGSCD